MGRENNTRNNRLAMNLVREKLFEKGCWVRKAPRDRKLDDSVDLQIVGHSGTIDEVIEVSVSCTERSDGGYPLVTKGSGVAPVGSVIYVFVDISHFGRPSFSMARSSDVWQGKTSKRIQFRPSHSDRDQWQLLGV